MRGFRKTSTSALGSSWLFLGRRRMNPDHWIFPNEPPQGPSPWPLATRFDVCTRVQWFPCFKESGIVVTVAVADVGSVGWGADKAKEKGTCEKMLR